MTTTAEAIEHKDVHGRTMWYLKIKHGNNEVFVNVGEKTFNNVKNIANEIKAKETNEADASQNSNTNTNKGDSLDSKKNKR